MEIVVGTYEEVLVGLYLTKVGDVYRITESFTDKSNIGSIRCVAISQQGLLASGGTDEIIHIFNLKNRRQDGTLIHHSGTVTDLQFFKKSNLFSTSEDGTLCAWQVGNWEPRTFKGHRGVVSCVALHPSGKMALTVGQDKSLRTWNLVDGRPAFVTNIKDWAEQVLWSPDGKYYIIGFGKKIDVYSVEDGQLHKSISTKHKVNNIVFVTDEVIAYGGEGTVLRGAGQREKAALFFLNIINDAELHNIQTESTRLRGLAICPSHEEPLSGQQWLTAVSSDGTINVYRVNASQSSIEVELIVSHSIMLRITCVAVTMPAVAETSTKPNKPGKAKRKPVTEESALDSVDESEDRISSPGNQTASSGVKEKQRKLTKEKLSSPLSRKSTDLGKMTMLKLRNKDMESNTPLPRAKKVKKKVRIAGSLEPIDGKTSKEKKIK